MIHQSWTGLSGICLCNNKNDYVQLGLLWPLCTVPGIYFTFSSLSLVKKVQKSLGGGKERNQNERVKWKQQWVTHLAVKNTALVCVSPRALRE